MMPLCVSHMHLQRCQQEKEKVEEKEERGAREQKDLTVAVDAAAALSLSPLVPVTTAAAMPLQWIYILPLKPASLAAHTVQLLGAALQQVPPPPAAAAAGSQGEMMLRHKRGKREVSCNASLALNQKTGAQCASTTKKNIRGEQVRSHARQSRWRSSILILCSSFLWRRFHFSLSLYSIYCMFADATIFLV